jgi:cell division transport system ATP-binding protein
MIEFSHVYKTYNDLIHALKNVTFKVDKGEFIFLTGPSGAGKSTLFKMLSAFDKPTSGLIEVCGYDLGSISKNDLVDYRKKIGVVFQDFKLLGDRTVFENVALPLAIRGEREATIKRKVFEMLEQVGLDHKHDELPGCLSGGEQQRTAIARALVHQPGVLIADEPTGNLDPELSIEIIDLFERACAQGTTVFIATHDHAMVKNRKKRTLALENGILTERKEAGVAWLR